MAGRRTKQELGGCTSLALSSLKVGCCMQFAGEVDGSMTVATREGYSRKVEFDSVTDRQPLELPK